MLIPPENDTTTTVPSQFWNKISFKSDQVNGISIQFHLLVPENDWQYRIYSKDKKQETNKQKKIPQSYGYEFWPSGNSLKQQYTG